MAHQLAARTSDALLSTATAVRGHFRRAIDLAAEDVSAIAVEPVLETLGWNLRDPRQARRSENGVLNLLSRGKPALRIRSLPAHTSIPGSLGETDLVDAAWIVLTNGLEWTIFNAQNPGRPFRIFSLADASSARDSLDVLALLDYEVFKPDALAEAWMAEAMDADVTRALMRHLDASKPLVNALQSDLKAQGLAMAEDDIRAALARIDIQAVDVAQPDVKAAPAEPASKPRTARAAKPAARTKSKSAVKPASKVSKPATAVSKDSAKTQSTTSKPATTARKGSQKKRGRPATQVGAPVLPEGLTWPETADYAMQRRKAFAFATYDRKAGTITLQPGSLIAAETGKTITPELQGLRDTCMTSGALVNKGEDLLELKEPLAFKTHRAAATFVAGTEVKDPTIWRAQDGKTLADALPKPKRKTKSKPKAKVPSPA